ncbi:MAG: radical SAM protein, partial [Maritimibacter sp.]
MTAPHPFHVMTKPIGPRCNIECSYCYYLEKEKLYPDEKKFHMQADMLECYIRDMIAAQVKAGKNTVSFAWQGGEPTMLGLDYFKELAALQKANCPVGVRIEISPQTNGMLLDVDWAAFFAREGFLIGISIDGPKQIHDRYRRDRA